MYKKETSGVCADAEHRHPPEVNSFDGDYVFFCVLNSA